jgi:hypothetical protein
MARLNSESGKGWFLAQGQESIEEMLANGKTQSDLAIMASMFKGIEQTPNSGAVSNILSGLCWGPFNGKEQPEKTSGERKPRANGGKRKGCLPVRLVASINKALGVNDPDSMDYNDDPSWSDFVRAREVMGNDWVEFIAKKCKGDKEPEQFALWVSSNDAADQAENATFAAQQAAIDAAIALIEKHGGKVVWA